MYNGRATRRLIVEEMKRAEELIKETRESTEKEISLTKELIKETRESTEKEISVTKELIKEEANRTQWLLEKLSEQHATMVNIMKASQV